MVVAASFACGGDGDEPSVQPTMTDAQQTSLASTTAATRTAVPATAQSTAGTWESLPALGSGARQETAVVVFGGEVVVLGGFDGRGAVSALVEAYSPASKTWRRLPDLPAAMHHANAAVVGDAMYIVGFLTGANFAPDGRIFALRKDANAWEAFGRVPSGQERGSSGVGVIDGKIYLAGGLRNDSVADFSRFDPSTGSSESLAVVPERRDHLAAGVIDGKFILAGGRGGAITSITGRVDVYDPLTGKWGPAAAMPTPRAGTAGAVLGGKLYVFGGEGNAAVSSGVFSQTEAYDFATNTWEKLAPMSTPRQGTGAVALGDTIYVPGGATKQAFGAVAIVEAFKP